ncbi:hypothetical protein SEA_MARIOKART_67 [Gordonia phage Mariokart]|nr:hypothetical protein SEA_MARIOKART_67 [Gordonia phage Mariokart]
MSATTTYTGTTPNGTTVKRGTKTMPYTHAVWVELSASHWTVEAGRREVGTQSAISFHTREDLAAKAAAKWAGDRDFAKVGVIAVTA